METMYKFSEVDKIVRRIERFDLTPKTWTKSCVELSDFQEAKSHRTETRDAFKYQEVNWRVIASPRADF